MNPEYIRAEDSRIARLIKATYVDPSDKAAAILDGVINPDLYCSAPCRIMWILKEPWDGPGCTGGEWSLTEDLLAVKPVRELSRSTFHPIIYITYGIFSDTYDYDTMPWVKDMRTPEMVLRHLAFINAKKLPGVTQGASARSIMDWYGIGKNIVLQQIRSYSPNIVFGCSPHLPAILEDLSSGLSHRMSHQRSASFVWHGDTLFVHVHHPGQRQLSRQVYVNDALAAVRSAMQIRSPFAINYTRAMSPNCPALTTPATSSP